AEELLRKLQVPARGQEITRFQSHLSGKPSLPIAHLRLLDVDLALRDAHPSRLPPVEVEGNAQADGHVIVRPGHIGLAPEIEHGVRTKSGLNPTPASRIHLRAPGA